MYRLLIGKSRPVGEGPSLVIHDPTTGLELGRLPSASLRQVDAAVRAATEASAEWAAMPAGERCQLLCQMADAIQRQLSEVARLESTDTGKPLAQVSTDEIPAAADCFRYLAFAARSQVSTVAGEYLRGATSYIRRDPKGVVGLIAPWNYPLMMAAWKMAPALAVGNTVVFKSSELTPMTADFIAGLAARLLPPGVVNIVHGTGEVVGEAIAAHPGVHHVSLTGSSRAGRAVMSAAAHSLKSTHLELGGNTPVLLFEDCELERACVDIARFAFYNAGQDCTACARVYAERRIYREVVERVTSAATGVVVGPPELERVQMGPLISADHLARVDALIKSSGGEITTGGEQLARPGYFYPPTVVACLEHGDVLVSSEIFGPVVTVVPFEDEAEALMYANDSPFGLVSSLWTGNARRAARLVPCLRFGVTWVNGAFGFANEMPHGGFRQSGYGTDLSIEALREFSVPRHVMHFH